ELGEYSPIDGATTASYALKAEDFTKWIKVQVSASNGVGSPAAALSNAFGVTLQTLIDLTPQDGVLELPAGTYTISTQLTIADGQRITIRGTGGKATIQQTVAVASATGRI